MSLDLGDTSAGEFDLSFVGGLLLLVGIENNINPDQTAHISRYLCFTLQIFAPLLTTETRVESSPKVIKLFSNSTQLRTKFILLIDVYIPTTVGILTFISMT